MFDGSEEATNTRTAIIVTTDVLLRVGGESMM
jgi:hypothetical protein